MFKGWNVVRPIWECLHQCNFSDSKRYVSKGFYHHNGGGKSSPLMNVIISRASSVLNLFEAPIYCKFMSEIAFRINWCKLLHINLYINLSDFFDLFPLVYFNSISGMMDFFHSLTRDFHINIHILVVRHFHCLCFWLYWKQRMWNP